MKNKEYIKIIVGLIGTLFIIILTSMNACSQGIITDETGVTISMDPIQVIYMKKGVPYVGPQIKGEYKAEAGALMIGIANCECLSKIDSIGSVIDISGLLQQRIYISDVLIGLSPK